MKRVVPGKAAKKKKDAVVPVKANTSQVGMRETSLVLFHALGKILSGKRTNIIEKGRMRELLMGYSYTTHKIR
jgi:hypothetical protein